MANRLAPKGRIPGLRFIKHLRFTVYGGTGDSRVYPYIPNMSLARQQQR
jgi:hypothetical protein